MRRLCSHLYTVSGLQTYCMKQFDKFQQQNLPKLEAPSTCSMHIQPKGCAELEHTAGVDACVRSIAANVYQYNFNQNVHAVENDKIEPHLCQSFEFPLELV